MRNHASWGSQTDVMIVFLNQDAYDRFKSATKRNVKSPKADGLPQGRPEGDINVEPEGIHDRQVRLTPFSTELHDGILSDDGRTLYYISEADDGCFLWELDLDEGDLEMKRRLSDPMAAFDATPDGKSIFIFGQSMQKLDGKGPQHKLPRLKTTRPAGRTRVHVRQHGRLKSANASRLPT